MMVLTRETVTVSVKPQPDVRKTIIDILRQQEGLKKQLHQLLNQLGHHGSQTLG